MLWTRESGAQVLPSGRASESRSTDGSGCHIHNLINAIHNHEKKFGMTETQHDPQPMTHKDFDHAHNLYIPLYSKHFA
jgi:hypothetical protein